MTPNYRPPAMILHRGQGSYAWDLDGKQYLDFTTGIGVNALGHNHPQVVAAIKEQAEILCHSANQFYHPNYVAICEKLCDISFGQKVFLCNSGTESMEAALKIARRHFFVQGESRTEFISTIGGFHGRTLGALSVTYAEKYRQGYSPLIPGVAHVPFNDIEAMAKAVTPKTAAVVLEPIQGNSGVIIPTPEYFEALRKICDDAGCLLILDEIQTGVGRTGKWFAYQHTNIEPDILTVAKALGGGLPLGAMITTEAVGACFEPGVHGSTFGGNPVACASGLATIRVIEEENLLANAQAMGAYFKDKLMELAQSSPIIETVRQQGLMIALALHEESKPYQVACRQAGLMVTVAGGSALRILPPLNTTTEEIDQAISILKSVFSN